MNAALDIRPANDAQSAPINIEAEQALIGSLLYDNAVFERLPDSFRGEHFAEPFHGRLFDGIARCVRQGHLADPILLAEQFARDPAFEDLGGVPYLADLIDHAPPAANAPDYARVIYDLARRRELIRIGGDIAKEASLPDADDTVDEMIERAEGALYGIGERGASGTGVITFSDALAGAVSMAAEAVDRDGALAGLSTGLIDLDRKIGGLHKSDLVILAARPSMGKTSLACNIAHTVAKAYRWEAGADGVRRTVSGGVVLFFSLEMSADQLALRICAAEARVSGDKVRKGEIGPLEFASFRDAAVSLNEVPLYIDATGGLPLAKLVQRARRQKRLHGLDLVVIDYLQLVTMGAGYRVENRVQEVTAITQGLKALAKDLNVPVLALSQLSRQVENREDKKPQLSDLRESGSIEQDADMVMFLFREEYYLGRTEPEPGTTAHADWTDKMEQARGRADLIIGKQRHGPIGTVPLSFHEDLTLFGNIARERDSAAYGRGRNPAGDQ